MNHFGDKTGRLGKLAALGLLGVILCPCTCSLPVPQEPTPEGQIEAAEEEIEETLKFLVGSSEIPLGTFETYDLDNDGKDDRFVYSLSEEEVTEDLFLRRNIEYQEADYGYDGRIELRFENKGDEAVEYWHIEEIPKEFAESADDLEFSVPPDEIIDPDPKVKWRVQLDRQTADQAAENFLNIIKRAASTDLEKTSHDLTKTVLVYQMRTLDRLVDKKDRDKRLLELARQFRREIAPKLPATAISNPEALATLCGRASNPAIYHACEAILTDDATRCDKLEGAGDRDLCKALLIHARCEGIKDQKEREECYFLQAIDLGSELACLYIKAEDDKHLCMAGVTGKEDYCQKITDPDKRRECLEAIGKKSKEVVYDIDSWWSTGEKARYEGLVSGFDTKDCEPVVSSLYCDYRTVWQYKNVPEECAEREMTRWFELEINTWRTDAAARKHWREERVGFYTEDEIRRKREELDQAGLGGYILVESEAILLYEPHVHIVDGHKCGVIHTHSFWFLYNNCIVSIQDMGAPTQDLQELNSAINPVKALIDEKRSADEQR